MKTITNETMKSSATATQNAKSMRQLLMMQTHAAIVATLPQASHGGEASLEKAENLLKLYGYKNPVNDKNGIQINTYERDLNARRALFYLTSGYIFGEKSYRNLEV
jgi:hypothetical protein